MLILIAFLALTIAAYSASRYQQHVQKQQQQAKENALVDIAKGVADIGHSVRAALEEKQVLPASGSPPPGTISVNQDTSPTGQVWTVPYRRNPLFTGRQSLTASRARAARPEHRGRGRQGLA
jgi:hypothetical protein